MRREKNFHAGGSRESTPPAFTSPCSMSFPGYARDHLTARSGHRTMRALFPGRSDVLESRYRHACSESFLNQPDIGTLEWPRLPGDLVFVCIGSSPRWWPGIHGRGPRPSPDKEISDRRRICPALTPKLPRQYSAVCPISRLGSARGERCGSPPHFPTFLLGAPQNAWEECACRELFATGRARRQMPVPRSSCFDGANCDGQSGTRLRAAAFGPFSESEEPAPDDAEAIADKKRSAPAAVANPDSGRLDEVGDRRYAGSGRT